MDQASNVLEFDRIVVITYLPTCTLKYIPEAAEAPIILSAVITCPLILCALLTLGKPAYMYLPTYNMSYLIVPSIIGTNACLPR